MVQVDKDGPNSDKPRQEESVKEDGQPQERIIPANSDSDKPVSDQNDDLLDRGTLAEHIADMINNLNNEDSIVIGIEGEWGEGKTSLINFILEKVRPNDKNLVIKFNPWNFSNQNELIKDFFRSITDELSKPKKTLILKLYRRLYKHSRFLAKLYRRLIRDLRRVLNLRILRPFVWISRFSVWLIPWLFSSESVTVSEEMESYASKLLEDSEINFSPEISVAGIGFKLPGLAKLRWGSHKPLEKQQEGIYGRIKKIRKRIVIVIDDIDRLDSEETKLIFKLVKLTFKSPKTVFILAYDRAKVGQHIDKQGISGEEYLKKIVQHPIPIPKPDPEVVIKLLEKTISEKLRRAGFKQENWQNKRYQDITKTSGFGIFSTLRDIKRYTNSLRLNLGILNEKKVDLVDFIGVEIIRVFAPEVYLAMPSEMALFTSPNEDPNLENNDEWQGLYSEKIKEILNRVQEKRRNSIRDILHFLFPLLPSKRRVVYNSYILDLSQGILDSSREKVVKRAWRKDKRVCAPGTFGQYFLLTTPRTHLSLEEVKRFFEAAKNSAEDIKKELETIQKEHKLLCLFNRPLSDAHLDKLGYEYLLNILVGVFNFVEGADKEGAVDCQLILQVEDVGYQILERIEKRKRVEFLLDLLEKTEISLMVTVFLDSLVDELKVYEKQENGEPLLTREEIKWKPLLLTRNDINNDIKKVGENYAKKIKAAADDDSLRERKRWVSALFAWRRWGVEKDVKKHVTELLDTDKGPLTFLKGLHSYTMTRVDTDIYVEGIDIIGKKSLGAITDIKKLDGLVEKLTHTKLENDDAKIVKSYKNLPKYDQRPAQ